jgi:thymidine phosphorylase
VTREVGCAIIGQTAEIAPADKRLYAIRDVTATVESIDLITASILSKKLAAGLDALVLDVKCGSGAFMATQADARALAGSLVEVANGAGCRTSALITGMNQPLASAAGNAVEVANAAAFLTGDVIDPRLWQVTVALGGELLMLGGLADSAEAGGEKISQAFRSGRAAEVFGRMVAALGGPADFLERHGEHLPAAPVVREIAPAEPGLVTGIDTRALGIAVIGLGGGRKRAADPIDHAVGFTHLAPIGSAVDASAPLARVHARTADAAAAAAEALRAAYATGEQAPAKAAVILDRVG